MKHTSNFSVNDELVHIKSADVKELPLISYMYLNE